MKNIYKSMFQLVNHTQWDPKANAGHTGRGRQWRAYMAEKLTQGIQCNLNAINLKMNQ